MLVVPDPCEINVTEHQTEPTKVESRMQSITHGSHSKSHYSDRVQVSIDCMDARTRITIDQAMIDSYYERGYTPDLLQRLIDKSRV